MAIDLPPDHITCHRAGHARKCRDLCLGCRLYQQVEGTDANSGAKIAGWHCVDELQVAGAAGVIQAIQGQAAEISALRADIRRRATSSGAAPARGALPAATGPAVSLIEQAARKQGGGT